MARTKEGLDTFDHNPRTVRSLTLTTRYARRADCRWLVWRHVAARSLWQRSDTSRIWHVHLFPVEEVGGDAKAERAARWQAVELGEVDVRLQAEVGGFIAGGPKGNNRTAQAIRIR